MEELIERLRNDKTIDTIYGLRFDTSFKNMYQDEEILRKMLKDLFHVTIEAVENFKDRELVKDNIHLKCGRYDLVLETKDSILLIEMQNNYLKGFKKRLKRYISFLYATQKIEKSYNEIKPVKTYLILGYPEKKKKVLKHFLELEKEVKEKFDDLSEIMVWNIIEALKQGKGIDYEYARLYLLDKFEKEEALDILKELLKNKDLQKIVEKVILYNLDLKTYQKLKEEKEMETTFEIETSGMREEAERTGEKRGIITGKLETANKLLSRGVPLELIIEATGLKEQQIRDYKR